MTLTCLYQPASERGLNSIINVPADDALTTMAVVGNWTNATVTLPFWADDYAASLPLAIMASAFASAMLLTGMYVSKRYSFGSLLALLMLS